MMTLQKADIVQQYFTPLNLIDAYIFYEQAPLLIYI